MLTRFMFAAGTCAFAWAAACTMDFEAYRSVPGAGGAGMGGNTGGAAAGGAGGGGGSPPTGPGSTLWAQQLGGPGLEVPTSVAVALDGSVVVFGSFTESITIGSDEHLASGQRDLFLATFDADGQPLWSTAFGGMAGDEAFAKRVVVGGAGNIIIAGDYIGDIDLGDGLTSSSSTTDVFVAKYTASGTHLWSRKIGGDTDNEVCNDLAIHSGGEVALTGSFFGSSLDFGNGPLNSAGQSDLYWAKLTSNGGYVDARSFGDSGFNSGNAIAYDVNGGILVAGSAQVSIDFGGGVLTSANSDNIVVALFDGAGMHLQSGLYGSSGSDAPVAGAFDPSGAIWLTGVAAGAIDFGRGEQAAFGDDDVFLLKLASNTTELGGIYGSTRDQISRDLAVNAAREVHVVGEFADDLDFGDDALMSAGGPDVFVVKLDESGAPVFSRRFGSSGTDRGQGVAVDDSGVYVVGDFSNEINFDGTAFSAVAESDGYLVKLRP